MTGATASMLGYIDGVVYATSYLQVPSLTSSTDSFASETEHMDGNRVHSLALYCNKPIAGC